MGRGRHYCRFRRWADAAQRPLYGSGWAAKVAYSLGLQGRLHVDHRTIDLGNGSGRSPLRVAFVSDLHAGPLTDPRLFDTAFGRIAEEAPDILLLGGDYVSLDHSHASALTRRLADLTVPLGIYGVLGNHDLWQDDDALSATLAVANVRMLVNEEVRLPAPHDRVVLYGMDDPGTGSPQGPNVSLREGDTRIVLMHSPLGLRHLEASPFHLAFCGHTHGGQIATPAGKPIVLPRGSGDRRQAGGGLFSTEGGQLLVSRGLGMSDLPVRLFAPSEVHLCTVA